MNSPGVADRTISVAATSIGGLVGAEASAEPAAAVDTLASFSARGPRRGDSALKPEIAAPGVAINSASQGTGTGTATFSGTSMATPFVAGAAALLHQLHPSWTVEEIKALLMNTARYNVTANDSQPPLLYSPARAGAGRLDIDAARRADLLVFNASDPGLVGLSFGSPAILGEMSALKNVRLVNKSPLSRTLYMDYVPIVDMPGVSFTVLGGSTRQLLPYSTLNVAVLLSAQADQLSNVADPTVAPKGVFPRHWLGEESGFLYVWPQQTRIQAQLSGANLLPPLANRITGLLDGSLAPDTGRLTYALTLTATEPITISSATLHLGQFHVNGPLLFPLPVTSLSGATPLTVTGAVTLTREMLSLLAAGGVYLQIGDVAHPNGAARGQLKPMDVVLRLPVYAAPRPTSAMRAQTTVLNYGSVVTGVQTLQLIGQGLLSVPTVQQAAFPTDTISLATALELQFSSPNEDTSSGLLNHADLKYVGIGSDWEEADDPAQTKLLFGLATYDNWSSPNEVLFRIHIDVDQNGEADFVLRSGNGSEFNLAASKDEFIAVLEDVRTGVRRPGYFRNLVSSAEFNTAVFNNSVALLAVSAGDIGLTTAQSSFVYSITTHSLDTEDPNTVIDRSPLLTYDVQNPGVQVEGLGNLPIFYDLPNTKIAVTANRNALVRNRSNGVVIMHFHNDIGERTEKVDLRFEMSLYLPQILGTQAAK